MSPKKNPGGVVGWLSMLRYVIDDCITTRAKKRRLQPASPAKAD
jgi:hypothetical protein